MRNTIVWVCALSLAGCATTEKSVSTDGTGPETKPIPRMTVRFHLASGKPVEGYREMTDRKGRPVYVAPDSVMSELDIVRARVVEDPAGRPAVGVTLSDEAGERFEEFTAAHIGDALAILVDDELVTAAVIRAKLGRLALIAGDFTPQRAEEIAQAISGR